MHRTWIPIQFYSRSLITWNRNFTWKINFIVKNKLFKNNFYLFSKINIIMLNSNWIDLKMTVQNLLKNGQFQELNDLISQSPQIKIEDLERRNESANGFLHFQVFKMRLNEKNVMLDWRTQKSWVYCTICHTRVLKPGNDGVAADEDFFYFLPRNLFPS